MNLLTPHRDSLHLHADTGLRRRGVAMVMVMVALAVATIIVLTFLSGQTTSMAIAHNASRQTQARAIAEDAIDLAMEYIRATPEWRDGYTHGTWTADQSLNGGTFRVMFEDEDDSDLGEDLSEPFILTAESTFDGVVHRISTRQTPQASTRKYSLVLIADETVPSAQDQAKAALFRSWGFSVIMISDDASVASYNSVLADADVVYVSEEASSGALGTKLVDVTAGVVCEEYAYADNLLMNTGVGAYYGTSIDIIDNSHAITDGLPLGAVAIATSSAHLALKSGTFAPGALTLAEQSGTSQPSLTAADTGATLTDNSVAPGRRVILPFGGSSFDIGLLNANGQTLLRQSLEWAARGTASLELPDPISLWKFEETAGSIATDSVSGHNGLYRTGSTLAAAGRSGYAVDLDGSSGHVEIAHHDDYLVDEGTIALWFYLDDTSGRQEIFSKDSSGYDTGGHLTIYANGDDVELRFQSNNTSYTLDSGSVLSSGTWHHAAFTFGGDGMKLYVDGAEVDTHSYTGGMGTSSGGTGNFEPIAIGANTWSSGNLTVSPLNSYFDGRIDEVGFYGSQLTAAEVVALYESLEATVSEDATEPSLVALYEFVEPTPVVPALLGHWKLDETGEGFVEQGGQVVMEAENYTASQAGTGAGASDTWGTTTDYSPSGVAMVAGPNTGHNMGLTTDGPRLDYQINFTTPGTYRVWVRTIGPSGNDDSVHVGLDGTCLTNASGWGLGRNSTSWTWVDDVASGPSNITLNIPAAGTYTFNLWMGEDGTLIDKIVLNTSASQPSGTGPSESELAGNAVDQVTVSDGSYESEPTLGQGGHGDGGVAPGFDGNDDFVEVPHNDVYLLNEGTLSFWFYANDLSGRQGLIAKDATNYGTGGHFRVYLNGSTLECRLQSSSSSKYVTASSSVSVNTWHHVAVGFGPGGLRLYLDGVERDTDSYTGGLGTSSGGTGNFEPWTFGVDQWHGSDLSSSGWDDPFHGRIDDVRLYDKNLNEDQAADLVALNDPGAAALATVEDTANVGTPLDLSIADIDHVTWISGGGLTIDTATTISSNGGVSRLHDALTQSEVFTLEAEFTPANITQDGPARIVTYSNGTSSRNFALGQTDAQYNARLRTALNSSGTPDAESGDVLVAGTKEHVIFTYDGEEVRLYRSGTLEVTEAWTGDLDNWDDAFELVLGNEVGGSRPWLGTLHRVAVWDGSVNQVQADNLFNGDPPGAPDGGDEGLEFVVEWLEKP